MHKPLDNRSEKSRFSIIIITIVVALVFCLTGCDIQSNELNDTSGGAEESSGLPEAMPQQEESMQKPPVRVQRNTENDLVIAMTAEDFTKAWNDACGREEKLDITLPPLNEFNMYEADEAIHSEHPTRHYVYAPGDEKFYPILDLYVSENSGELLQVDLNYDEHDYREETWELHEAMCRMALKILLQDMSTEDRNALCSNVYALGAENMFPNEQKYDRNAVPGVLLFHNDIGVYSYFATGSRSHFCLIPVDAARLDELKEAGTEIREISGYVKSFL